MPNPCTLQLDVFFPPTLEGPSHEDEVAWSVSTDPRHGRPYLLAPRQYAAQEIDPIGCTASIGQVEVGVIDVPTDLDDQDTGWMTARVHDLLGRRCRLRRYVDDAIGWVLVADGPAGAPKLDNTYAAYRWTIRGTRDTERKTPAFNVGGVTAVVPRGPIFPWGQYEDGSGSHVLLPSVLSVPMTGVMFTSHFGAALGGINLASHLSAGSSGLIVDDARLVVDDDAVQAMASSQIGEFSFGAKTADVIWRKAGDTNWNVARPRATVAFPQPLVGYADARVHEEDSETSRVLNFVTLYVEPSGDVPDGFPVAGDSVEFVIRYRGPATENLPYYVDDTLGNTLINLYTRVYARATNTGLGGFVYDPLGLDAPSTESAPIQYDPAAFAALTERVLLRQISSVDDARAFSESKLYQPSGWIPALDNAGQISPVSRSRPATVDAALTITNATVVPTPSWTTGDRIVSSIEYQYSRYFIPDLTSGFQVGADGIAARPIIVEYDDPDSFRRYGNNPEIFDASAFSAIGTPFGLNLPAVTEQAEYFAQIARFDVLQRFRAGVQVISIAARRMHVPTIRVGSWIPWTLSWLPDRTTGLRGSHVAAAQVVSIRDDNCVWRTLTLEESASAGALGGQPGYFDNLVIDIDDFDPGYFTDVIEVSDEAGEGGGGGGPRATGGTITTDGSFTVHTFLDSADFVALEGIGDVELLIVAGGGGGGDGQDRTGGGAGGGGVRNPSGQTFLAGTYPVVVGAGGVKGVGGVSGATNGANSSVHGVTSLGGGHGDGYSSGGAATGGSGGGSRHGSGGAAGTAGQGYAGGNTGSLVPAGDTNATFLACGGGGAAEAGHNPDESGNGTAGAGGNGFVSDIDGTSRTYGGGGGGSSAWYGSGTPGAAGAGGTGGGGAGGTSNAGAPVNGQDGVDGLGGGGGGGGRAGSSGGQGGKGRVVIRYLTDGEALPERISGPALSRAGWTVSALHSGGGFASDAIDGNNSSRWATGSSVDTANEWFKIDQGASVTIGAVRMNNSVFAGDNPVAGNVYTSDDDVTYTLRKAWTSADIDTGVLTVILDAPVACRYVRMNATATPAVSSNWWSIGEINLYADVP